MAFCCPRPFVDNIRLQGVVHISVGLSVQETSWLTEACRLSMKVISQRFVLQTDFNRVTCSGANMLERFFG